MMARMVFEDRTLLVVSGDVDDLAAAGALLHDRLRPGSIVPFDARKLRDVARLWGRAHIAVVETYDGPAFRFVQDPDDRGTPGGPALPIEAADVVADPDGVLALLDLA